MMGIYGFVVRGSRSLARRLGLRRYRQALAVRVAASRQRREQRERQERERERLKRIPRLSSIDPKKPVFVFFTPATGVQPFYVTHCVVARTMKELGHQVLLVRCDGQYQHCIFMEMLGQPIDKTEDQRRLACEMCQKTGIDMAAEYELPCVDMSELVEPATIAELDRAARSMPDDAGKFRFEGVPFALLCGSDLALALKISDQLRVAGEARRQLQAYVFGAMLSYKATQALAAKLSVHRLVFFNEYSMHLGAVIAAQKAQIPVVRMSLALHKSVDQSKVILLHDPLAIITYHRALDDWSSWRNLALPPAVVGNVADNGVSKLMVGGFSVYSPKHSAGRDDIFERLNLSADRRVLVAYTSSLDEYFSNKNLMRALDVDLFSEHQPFENQIEWLKALIAYVESSAHLQLVVRIHPREGANARESRVSEHLGQLKREFSAAYKHVRMIWPEDSTSSYDLAEIADLALTSWTNITMELARIGIPVITAFYKYVPFPLNDVVDWAPTPSGYFELLERVLSRPPDCFERVRFAYRWSNVYNLTMSLDFGDVVPSSADGRLPPFKMSSCAPILENVLVRGASTVAFNRNALVEAQSSSALDTESAELRRQMRRMIWLLATGEDRHEDFPLRLGPDDVDCEDGLVVTPRGNLVELRMPNRRVVRRSVAIARLAQVAIDPPQGADKIELMSLRS
jgi:hypothetical protein